MLVGYDCGHHLLFCCSEFFFSAPESLQWLEAELEAAAKTDLGSDFPPQDWCLVPVRKDHWTWLSMDAFSALLLGLGCIKPSPGCAFWRIPLPMGPEALMYVTLVRDAARVIADTVAVR